MDKYKDMICPVCGLSLEDGEVCVCPECGAPHHRECFLQFHINYFILSVARDQKTEL